MEFHRPPEYHQFRTEVSTFLKEKLGDPFWNADESEEEHVERNWEFSRDFARKGWIGLWWPREYGGVDAPYWHQLILQEELAYWEAPRGPMYIGWDRVAWALLLLGNDAQKARYLPAIQSMTESWSQGFSEPEAGSDLASLRTSARRDGDDFIVNGQKTFNSYGHFADHSLVAVRTDPDAPKHKGISLLLVDLRSEGVSIDPLIDMTGSHHFNNIFFSDVRVPAENVLGEVNTGWYGSMTTVDAERSGVAVMRLGWCRRAIAALLRSVAGQRMRPALRADVADLAVSCQVLELLVHRVIWVQESGRVPNVESSMATMFGCELEQRIYTVAQRIGPAMSLLNSKYAPLNGFLAEEYLHATSATVGGGTSEIKRDVIATRGCGLPRS